MRTVLFIVADEATNAGERDSMKAIAAAIKDHKQKDIDYLFYKIPGSSHGKGNSNTLPLTDTDYATIPRIGEETQAAILNTEELDIIGVGNTTFHSITVLDEFAKLHHKRARTHYITYTINTAHDQKTIVKQNIQVFSPMTSADLAKIDAKNAHQVELVEIDTVPHTNALLEPHHLDGILNDVNGANIQQLLNRKTPFVFAVVNGGSGIGEIAVHIPYTTEEAAAHGYALGLHLEAGTALIAAHGGPRNLVDEQQFNQSTMTSFVEAYKKAQQEKGSEPVILMERFERGKNYNAIKAGLILSKQENCVGFISNAEGFGTMAGAVMHIDNHKKLLGMLLFDAVLKDETGQLLLNTEKYNRSGIAILEPNADGLVVRKHPQELRTPLQIPDPSQQILEKLGLLSSKN